MAFVPVPNGAKVAVEFDLNGQTAVNTFYFTNPASFGLIELAALAEAVWDGYLVWVPSNWTPDSSLIRVTATDVRTQFAEQYVTTHSPVPGAQSAPSVPNNVALAVARRSGLTGRSTRGRIYIPVNRTGNMNTRNEVSSGFANGVVALLDGIADAAALVDWTEVIASFVQNGASLPAAITYVVVSRLVVDLTVDSMRRRLPGRGE